MYLVFFFNNGDFFFSGLLDVELHTNREGYITLVGYPIETASRKTSKLTVSNSIETDTPDIKPNSTSPINTSYWYV